MTAEPAPLVGAIEAGGTKMVCGLASGPDAIVVRQSLPTADPDGTIAAIIAAFQGWRSRGHNFAALGIGSFGPIELAALSPDFGRFKQTPKSGWVGVDLITPLRRALELPIALDTDVNAAALAEQRLGAARGLERVVYVTVGTGVGVGVVIDGRTVTEPAHPEAGHTFIGRADDEPDEFSGSCPSHGDCVEGLASGSAVVARFGARLGDLPTEHAAWRLETEYLATFCHNLTLTLQPDRIVLGGGVMRPALLAAVRRRFLKRLAGYETRLATADAVARYLVAPGLGDNAGLLGAMLLAQDLLARERG